MRILAIETSAVTCSAAYYDGEKITSELINTGLNHSATLMPAVERVLARAGAAKSDIDLFACSSGPGSFTGVRIGVSAVKGMAAAAGKPCAGVSTLEAIALSAPEGYEGLVCAAMDARRGQFYNALFELHGGSLRRLTEDGAEAGEEIAARLKQKPVLLMGDGARAFLPFAQGLTVTVPENEGVYQRAEGVIRALLASDQYTPVPPGELLPVYLRPSQAERMRNASVPQRE